MKSTEAQRKASLEYYHANKEKCLENNAAWVFSNPDRVRLHARRHYNKKQALIAAKANDVDSMVKYTKRYLECGAKLGIKN